MQNKSGPISSVLSFLMVLVLAIKLGAFPQLWRDLSQLFHGEALAIPIGARGLIEFVPYMFAALAVELPVTIFLAAIHSILLGTPAANSFRGKGGGSPSTIFRTFFLLCLAEEVFARWIFLGAFRYWHVLAGPIMFYALMLLGNTIWALLHLPNYKESSRHPLRVVPQFWAGLVFTVVFYKFGLLAAVLTHFASNAIIFASCKVEELNLTDIIIVVVSAAIAGLAYHSMQRPLVDLLQWFRPSSSFALPGWGFFDYFKLILFIGMGANVIFDLLLYDKGHDLTADRNKKPGFFGLIAVHILGAPIILLAALVAVLVLWVSFWLTGFMSSELWMRCIIAALISVSYTKVLSLSASSRAFFCALPVAFVNIAALQAVGVWWGVLLVSLYSAATIPRTALYRYDT